MTGRLSSEEERPPKWNYKTNPPRERVEGEYMKKIKIGQIVKHKLGTKVFVVSISYMTESQRSVEKPEGDGWFRTYYDSWPTNPGALKDWSRYTDDIICYNVRFPSGEIQSVKLDELSVK